MPFSQAVYRDGVKVVDLLLPQHDPLPRMLLTRVLLANSGGDWVNPMAGARAFNGAANMLDS